MTVDHDLLADYVGGALEGTPEQERVAGLIATSPEWGHAAEELTAALDAVQHDLSVFAASPEPMPQDVAARFDGLFDGPRRDPLESRVVARHSGRAKAKKWKKWSAPVAIMAVVLGLFGLGKLPSFVSQTMNEAADGGKNSNLTAEAPGAAPQGPVPTTASGRMYERSSVAKSLAITPGSSRTADGGFERQDSSTTAQAPPGALVVPPPLQRLIDPIALQECLNAVARVVPGRVELVDYAYFEGSPALVITITSANGPWLFVAGGNCGQLGPDEKFQTSLK